MRESKMKVLFLGYAVSPAEADCMCGASVAGNKMQLNLIKGFSSNLDVDLKVITILPIAHYFRSKKLIIKSEFFKVFDCIEAKKVHFVNLPVIKTIGQIISSFFEMLKIVESDTIVFTFNLFPHVGIPAFLIKSIKKCKVVSIIADPPIYDKCRRIGVFKKAFAKITEILLSKSENLIVLNKAIVPTYSPHARYIVVEGGIDLRDIIAFPYVQRKKEHKVIMYSGALTEYSGIMNAVRAMDMIDDSEIELHIYGSGLLEKDIREASEKDKRIKYCGRVSNNEILELQRNAFLLINPRIINDPIAELTFPSKTFEYLASGTPVLSTRLNAYSDCFLQHIFTCGDTVEELASAIEEICSMDASDLQKKASDARDFVLNEMNWNVQNKRIYHFLRNVV